MKKFEKAMQIAMRVHENQEYAGLPYFFHPLRVAMMLGDNMRPHHDRETCVSAMCVAVLHDTIEDRDGLSLEFLKGEIIAVGKEILPMVEALSRKPNQKYMDYIKTLQKQPAIVRWVKLCDIRDHLLHGDSLKEALKNRYLLAHLSLSGQPWRAGGLPPMFSLDPGL